MKKLFLLIFVFAMPFSLVAVAQNVDTQALMAQIEQLKGLLFQLQTEAGLLSGENSPAREEKNLETIPFTPLVINISRGGEFLEANEIKSGEFEILLKNAKVKNIYENGNMLVEAVGLEATVMYDNNTRIVHEGWGNISKSSVEIGDLVNIWGTYNDLAPAEVMAKTVRNLSYLKK